MNSRGNVRGGGRSTAAPLPVDLPGREVRGAYSQQYRLTPSSSAETERPAWEDWLTPEQRADWEGYSVRLGRVVGEAVESARCQVSGVKILENERLGNGLCRLRLQRYGREPEVPREIEERVGCDWVGECGVRSTGCEVQVMRWRDEDVPMFYLYVWWKEEVIGNS